MNNELWEKLQVINSKWLDVLVYLFIVVVVVVVVVVIVVVIIIIVAAATKIKKHSYKSKARPSLG